MKQNNDKKIKKEDEPSSIKPDPETLGKTDPQEHMKGPVSSLVKKAEEAMNNEEQVDTPASHRQVKRS